MGVSKQARYRARRRADGCCPHCGGPCAPYSECADRRAYKRLVYMLTRMAKYGRLVKSRDAAGKTLYANGDPSAPMGVRGIYRTAPSGRGPAGFTRYAIAALRSSGVPMTEEALVEAFLASKGAA